ncbi:MAG: inositol 2-dehydrogenase [Candidatus Lokiarchaeota archaeon]|nr:inositol 2-dehydrogenase [Candidatus Lokiarchaeota archaeon]
MADKKFVVGILGAGRIGKIHAANCAQIPGVKIKTIVDLKVDGLKDWAAKLGVEKLSTDPKDIFGDPEINAVLICSSTDTHAQFIVEAAKAKKDIFCEKPIDYDLKRIKDTLAAVAKAGVKLMIGFNRRFDHNHKRVRDAVVNGEIGKVHIVKVTSRDPSPPPIEYVKVSGGLFFDMTVHDWDMAAYLAGEEIVEIYAAGGVLVDPKIGQAGDIDTAAVVLKFKSGALGLVDNSRQAVYGYDQRTEVFGSKGGAWVDNDFPNQARIYSDKIVGGDKMHHFFLERYMGSYTAELQEFFDCLRNNKNPSVGGIDGLNAVLVAMAAMKSLKENRPVKISEVNV